MECKCSIKLNSEEAAQWGMNNLLGRNQGYGILKMQMEGLIENAKLRSFENYLCRCSQHNTRMSGVL